MMEQLKQKTQQPRSSWLAHSGLFDVDSEDMEFMGKPASSLLLLPLEERSVPGWLGQCH